MNKQIQTEEKLQETTALNYEWEALSGLPQSLRPHTTPTTTTSRGILIQPSLELEMEMSIKKRQSCQEAHYKLNDGLSRLSCREKHLTAPQPAGSGRKREWIPVSLLRPSLPLALQEATTPSLSEPLHTLSLMQGWKERNCPYFKEKSLQSLLG